MLSAKAIEKAPAKDKEYKLADGKGLFLRIRPTGAKSWVFLFRLPGSRKLLRMTIGSLGDISLKEARSKLPELRKLVAEGIDPRNARAALKANNAQAMTMQALFDSWIDFAKITNKFSLAWAKKHENRWRLHLKNSLGKLFIKDITRAHLASALDSMTRRGIKEETRKALTTLNLMMDYALTRHLIDQNHARVLKPKDFSATANRPRDRVLSLEELKQLWLAIDASLANHVEGGSSSSLEITTAIAIKLLILTGARRSEVAGMRWSELDLESGTWTLPPNRTKNRQPHIVFLPELSINLLKQLYPLSGHSLFVFETGRGTQGGHIQPDSLNKALGRLRKKENCRLNGIKQFRIHDLRRTAATVWGEQLKTDPHIIEKMLNHQPLNKLIATYQRAIYASEQKKTWLAWGLLINEQIMQQTVYPFAVNKSYRCISEEEPSTND